MRKIDSQYVEFNMIAQDAIFYRSLLPLLSEHSHGGTFPFGIFPYIALFIVESFSYLNSIDPSYEQALTRKYNDVIINSRHRHKLFDDSGETNQLIKWTLEFHQKWFVNKHNGILAGFKRFIQNDIGLYFYENHLYCSTLAGFLNSGLNVYDLPTSSGEINKALSSLSHNYGYEMGKSIGKIIRDFRIDNRILPLSIDRLQSGLFSHRDKKSHKYFPEIFNGGNIIEINILLLIILGTINFIRLILVPIFSECPETLLKIKYITLFHVRESLNKLQAIYRSQKLLSAKSITCFGTIISDNDYRSVCNNINFRNILVHYGIERIPESALSLDRKLFGLVEYTFNNEDYDSLNAKLDNQLNRIASIMEDWMEAGSNA